MQFAIFIGIRLHPVAGQIVIGGNSDNLCYDIYLPSPLFKHRSAPRSPEAR